LIGDELVLEVAHLIEEGTAPLDNPTLALGPITRGEDVANTGQLFDELGYRSTPDQSPGLFDDQFGVDTESTGEPAVLAHGSLAWRSRELAGVEPAAAPDDHCLGEGGQTIRLAQRRWRVAHAELDGPEVGVRPNVPPHLADR
jgi:hypothetical protein